MSMYSKQVLTFMRINWQTGIAKCVQKILLQTNAIQRELP